jgi:hypothetical protein
MDRLKQFLLRTVVPNIDWAIAVVVAVVVAVLGLLGGVQPAVLSSATLFVLGVIAVGAIQDRMNARELRVRIDAIPAAISARTEESTVVQDARRTGLARLLDQVVDYNWLDEIENARTIEIFKIRCNFIENPRYVEAFEEVIARGGSITLVLSDPRAMAMWLRYTEEPKLAGRGAVDDEPLAETAWVNGLEELAVHVARLHAWRSRLVRSGIRLDQLRIGLFPNYPTMAYLRFDDRLFVYSYPYLARGFHTPAMLFDSAQGSAHLSLLRCQQRVVRDRIEIDDDVAGDIANRLRAGTFSDRVVRRSELRAVRRRT